EDLLPASVTHARGPFGRPHDVGEHDRLEDAVDLVLLSASGEELLDLVEDLFVLAQGALVEVARILRESGSGNVFGEVAPVRDIDDGVAGAVDDERRRTDRAERVAGVYVQAEPVGRRGHGRGGRASLEAGESPPGGLVIRRILGRDQRHDATVPPDLL